MSWEDDDYEVPTLHVAIDDEEDLLLVEKREAAKRLASGPTSEQIALMEKKAEEDAIRMQNKLKMMELEKMTPEERRLREKKLVEEGDNQLALELFSGSTKGGGESSGLSTPKSGVIVNAAAIKNVKAHAGLASIVVQSKQDHITFGSLVAKKIETSTSDNIKLFLDTFIGTIESKIDIKELKIITDNLLKLQTKRNEEAAEKAKKEKAKKDAKADRKKKDAIFGEDYVDELTDKGLDYEDRFGF